MTITIHFDDAGIAANVQSMDSHEAVGEPSRFDVTITTAAPIVAKKVLETPCVIAFETELGKRSFAGVITKVTTVVQAAREDKHAYRVRVESKLAVLRLRTRSRVYREKTGFEIVVKVLREGGYKGDALRVQVGPKQPARVFTVQYAETDATFVRRICEEDGLYFFFDVDGDREIMVLADDSTNAKAARATALPVFEGADEDPEVDALSSTTEASATKLRMRRRRRPGRVTLRDYDPAVPATTLQGESKAGLPLEQKLEYYEAPGQFQTEGDGNLRAERRLQSLRADGSVLHFRTDALDLAPGRTVALEARSVRTGTALPKEVFVLAVRHKPDPNRPRRQIVEVDAIPRTVPFRLPLATPAPRLPGLDTAEVTGTPGEEIHPDELGRVFVRFHWDLDGERDEKSSLPVRVTQAHTKGPLILPRVGWEVLVAFEDGDPDRPVVVGRSFNGKMLPPFALPANKTITSFATDSSPGGKKRSAIHFDDAAGRQHFKVQAPFLRETFAAGELKMKVNKNERYSVTGNQSFKTLGKEDLSVKEGFFETLGTQTILVGGSNSLATGGNQDLAVGTETVIVLGAQIEQVGNPVKGALELGASAVIEGVSSRGIAGAVVGAGLGIAKAAFDGYTAPTNGGWAGAAQAAKMGVIGIGAGMIPGGDAVLSGITGTANPNPWDSGHAVSGSAAPGGGAGPGASDAAAAVGPGKGYRQILAEGVGVEGVAGPLALITPGKVAVTTLGAVVVRTGGSRTVKAMSVAQRIGGASLEVVGSLNIDAANIARRSRGAGLMKAEGALTVDAMGVNVEGPRLKIKVGGTMTMEGGVCMFVVPGASVSSFDGCVFLHATNIEITGECEQSGAMIHK